MTSSESERIQSALRAFHVAVRERKRLDEQMAVERADRGVKSSTYDAAAHAEDEDYRTGQALRKVLLETELESLENTD